MKKIILCGLTISLVAVAFAAYADRPTYMQNNQRVAVTGESLVLPLNLKWEIKSIAVPDKGMTGAAGKQVKTVPFFSIFFV